ncbi:hypothetical protein M431DRAFT_293406 [Trichoderma harzianum CBS 226.95]|jgi:hypothetical protein|uniref:Uncharacterized protein n=1 Tax=Trichoderma harzianum CBS 226.95 TaxID=983964 RepID=A0A2T4AQ21_TRIHA|nr:hypothetical protein M431DRAFT_293406 [Trichoderma harzianum CBS 226.95]PTB59028.1 hypothetical protein M431DRAFT_293406 [Trichoderma harzianum CBS 226.95]
MHVACTQVLCRNIGPTGHSQCASPTSRVAKLQMQGRFLFYYSQVRIGPIRKYRGNHIVRRTGGCPRYQVLVSKCRGDQDLCPLASYPSSPTAGYENAACLMRLHNNTRQWRPLHGISVGGEEIPWCRGPMYFPSAQCTTMESGSILSRGSKLYNLAESTVLL